MIFGSISSEEYKKNNKKKEKTLLRVESCAPTGGGEGGKRYEMGIASRGKFMRSVARGK